MQSHAHQRLAESQLFLNMKIGEFESLVRPCFELGELQARSIDLFCSKFRPYLWIILSRLSPSDLSMAEDALQESFIKYIDIFRRGNAPIVFPGYYVTIAKRCLIDEMRRRRRNVELEELLRFHPAAEEMFHPSVAEFEDIVISTLDRIDGRCRFVLERYYLAGIKGSTLAREIGISPKSLPMIVKRCRDQLRALVENQIRSGRGNR